jgi:hypothetical protein
VRLLESERKARRARLATLVPETGDGHTTLHRLAPRLDIGVRVERQPILAEGEFVWGYVLRTAGYPEGMPCSALVARLVSAIDGDTSVEALVARLGEGREAGERAVIEGHIMATLQILYVDGTIADFRGG